MTIRYGIFEYQERYVLYVVYNIVMQTHTTRAKRNETKKEREKNMVDCVHACMPVVYITLVFGVLFWFYRRQNQLNDSLHACVCLRYGLTFRKFIPLSFCRCRLCMFEKKIGRTEIFRT